MVFGEVLKLNWMHTTFIGNFFLAFIFTVLALISAAIIFPSDVGIMMISFIALLFLPSLDIILTNTASTLFTSRKATWKGIYAQHKPIFKLFLAMFLAIFIVCLATALILPEELTENVFIHQLNPIREAVTGFATETDFSFNLIARNNLKVIFVTYLFSMIYGAGSILMIGWNASVWGIIFGYILKKGIIQSGMNPIIYIIYNLGPSIPHILFEAGGYLFAAIGGGVLAMFLVHRNIKSKKFLWMLTDSFFLLTIGITLILFGAFLEIAGL